MAHVLNGRTASPPLQDGHATQTAPGRRTERQSDAFGFAGSFHAHAVVRRHAGEGRLVGPLSYVGGPPHADRNIPRPASKRVGRDRNDKRILKVGQSLVTRTHVHARRKYESERSDSDVVRCNDVCGTTCHVSTFLVLARRPVARKPNRPSKSAAAPRARSRGAPSDGDG